MNPERRNTTLTEQDIERLREIIYSGIAPDVHRQHHEAMSLWIARENRKAERYEKVKTHVIGWSAVSAISGFIYAIGNYVKLHWR